MPASGSRRSRRPRADRDDASHRAAKRIAAIDRAFDAAVSGPSPTTEKPRRSAGRAVVPDDENDNDDDETMLEAVNIAPSGQPNADQGGGFMPDVDEPAYNAAGGGGFLPEPEAVAPFPTNTTGSGGGGGGGFLLPEDTDMDGGFLPDPNNVPPSGNTFQGGGGFLVDEAGGDSEQLAGGFLPESDAMPDYSNEGGFLALPEVPQQFLGTEPSASDLLPLPDPNAPPPRDRIALNAIPTALRSLGLHQIGLQGAEVTALFEEVASDDEEAEGGKSVQRERFKEACQVLLGSDDDEDDNGASDSGDQAEYREAAGEDEDDFTGSGRRRLRRGGTDATTARGALKEEEPTRVQPKRRSARGKPSAAGDKGAGAAGNAPVLDALPADFEEDDESSFESESDAENQSAGKGKKGNTKAQTKKGKRGRRVAVDPAQPLSQEDLAAASDTFDLFFEESPQLPFAQKDRHISLLELQRACRVLKEKMTDGDLNEMLEYAARGRGSVNLDAFARILLETGL